MERLLLLDWRLGERLEALIVPEIAQKLPSLEGRRVVGLLPVVELCVISLVRVCEHFLQRLTFEHPWVLPLHMMI